MLFLFAIIVCYALLHESEKFWFLFETFDSVVCTSFQFCLVRSLFSVVVIEFLLGSSVLFPFVPAMFASIKFHISRKLSLKICDFLSCIIPAKVGCHLLLRVAFWRLTIALGWVYHEIQLKLPGHFLYKALVILTQEVLVLSLWQSSPNPLSDAWHQHIVCVSTVQVCVNLLLLEKCFQLCSKPTTFHYSD